MNVGLMNFLYRELKHYHTIKYLAEKSTYSESTIFQVIKKIHIIGYINVSKDGESYHRFLYKWKDNFDMPFEKFILEFHKRMK
jgi:hypothetical protein